MNDAPTNGYDGQQLISAEGQRDVLDDRKRRFAREYHELTLRTGVTDGIASIAFQRVFPEKKQTERGGAVYRANLLLKDDVVAQHLTYLRGAVIKRHAASVDRVIEELERIAFANPMDVISINSTGEPVIVLDNVNALTAAAIASITTRTTKNSTTTSVTFHDKNAALAQLSKIFGIEQNRLTLTVEQLDQLIAAYEARGVIPGIATEVHEMLPA